MNRDLAYRLNSEAPLDLTVQTLMSGTHINIGKRMDLVPGRSLVFWFYGQQCVGVSDLLLYANREKRTAQLWTGPLRAMNIDERMRTLGAKAPNRGGEYL